MRAKDARGRVARSCDTESTPIQPQFDLQISSHGIIDAARRRSKTGTRCKAIELRQPHRRIGLGVNRHELLAIAGPPASS